MDHMDAISQYFAGLNEFQHEEFFGFLTELFHIINERPVEDLHPGEIDEILDLTALNLKGFGNVFNQAEEAHRKSFANVVHAKLLAQVTYLTTTKTIERSDIEAAFIEAAKKVKAA